MRIIKPIISFLALSVLLLPIIVIDAAVVPEVEIKNPLKFDTFHELLDKIIDFIFVVSIPITVIVIIVAGYMFIAAAGEAEKIAKARQAIQWALIGFMVILLAKGLIALFGQILGVKTPYN